MESGETRETVEDTETNTETKIPIQGEMETEGEK